MRKTKKIICLILLTAVILSVISPVFLGVANGASVQHSSPKSPCAGWGFPSKPIVCGKFLLAGFMFHVVYRVTNWFTMAGGAVFNAAIFFSLSGEAFDTAQNSLISIGWKATRDFANLFFIFIILYIAIATILQLSGYGSKSLLVKVIIVALLINFSLMITKVVIDASHVLAWEFYNKIDVSGGGEYQIADNEPVNIEIQKEIERFKSKNLAAVFMAGFNPQKIVGGQDRYNEQKKALDSGASIEATFWEITLIYALGSIVNLIVAFILFAGGILFIIRVVVLWFVMILSPLAFIGMILPGKMAGLAKEWWGHLFNQSFFAPAFLFLFYLVTVMINSKFLQNMIKSSQEVGTSYGGTLMVIFHFIIIAGLTIGCLIIAKKMGAVGADTMMSWGKKLQGAAQGYAGRGAKYVGMAPLRGAGYGADVAAGGIDTGKGKWAQTLRAMPGLGKWAASRSEKVRKDIEERKKEYGKHSEQELKERMAAPEGAWGPVKRMADFTKGIGGFVRRSDRAAIVGALAEKKSLDKGVAEKMIERATKTISGYGAKTKDIDRLRPDLVKGNVGEFIKNVEKEHKDMQDNYKADPIKYQEVFSEHLEAFDAAGDYNKTKDEETKNKLQKMADREAQNKVIKKLSAADHLELSDDVYLKDDIRKMIINNLDSSRAQKIIEKGGIAMDKVMEDLVNAGDKFEAVATSFETKGRRSLASWARGPAGVEILNSYGPSMDKKRGKAWIHTERKRKNTP